MANKIFLIGIVAGLAAALGLAGAFSILSTQQGATAQMMGGNQGMMGMMDGNQGIMKHSMFSANGMSMVQDVRITGVSITGDNEISVNLTYSGNRSAPSVTVIAMTNHMQMMGMMMCGSSMGGMGGMMGSGMTGSQSMGNMDMMGGNTSSMMTPPYGNHTGMGASMEPQTGSALVESGWQSEGNTVTIRLDGNTSAYGASDVHVMVFPH
jgi:hypothetical protein